MDSSKFDAMARLGNYRRIGMFPQHTGQIYLAEKTQINENGEREFVTMWAAAKSADDLEVAQQIHFKWGTSRHLRETHALQMGQEYLAMRDYSGDSRR